MRLLGLFFVTVVIISCSSNQGTLEDYANFPVKFAKQKITYPNNDFTVCIPKNWNWKVEDYNNDHIILGIGAGSEPDKDGFIDFITIQKVKCFGGKNDLKSEYDYLLNLTKQQSNGMKIVETGETDMLHQTAYFFHSKSETNTYGESEMICFVLEGDLEGTFYYLNAGASQTKNFKRNMAILLHSLKTFEIHKTKS
nr:hypothetical protein [Chitinophagaceae bacterium]